MIENGDVFTGVSRIEILEHPKNGYVTIRETMDGETRTYRDSLYNLNEAIDNGEVTKE